MLTQVEKKYVYTLIKIHLVIADFFFQYGSEPDDDYTLDINKQFKFRMFSVKASNWTNLRKNHLLCLGSQTTVDRLYWLVEIVERWPGPISMSLFVPDVEYGIAQTYMKYLKQCFPTIRKQVLHDLHVIVLWSS